MGYELYGVLLSNKDNGANYSDQTTQLLSRALIKCVISGMV